MDECGKGAGRGASPFRKLLRGFLTAGVDILPKYAKAVVHILGLENDPCDRYIDALLFQLYATNTLFLGTDLRMIYEVAKVPISTQPASPRIIWGQEV